MIDSAALPKLRWPLTRQQETLYAHVLGTFSLIELVLCGMACAFDLLADSSGLLLCVFALAIFIAFTLFFEVFSSRTLFWISHLLSCMCIFLVAAPFEDILNEGKHIPISVLITFWSGLISATLFLVFVGFIVARQSFAACSKSKLS